MVQGLQDIRAKWSDKLDVGSGKPVMHPGLCDVFDSTIELVKNGLLSGAFLLLLAGKPHKIEARQLLPFTCLIIIAGLLAIQAQPP